MNKPKVRKVYIKLLALMTTPLILNGCVLQSECNVIPKHVHKYINKDGLVTYMNSENFSNSNFYWQNEYIEITNDDELFYNAKRSSFYGPDNWNYLYNKMASRKDYLEFYYEYTTDDYISQIDEDGNDYGYWTTTTHSGWTKDPKDSDNTGLTHLCHHKYFGYRFVYKDGSFHKEQSPLVDDIRDIINDYPYFDEDCVKIVHKDFNFNRRDLPNLKTTDFDVYNQPDLSNKELKGKEL